MGQHNRIKTLEQALREAEPYTTIKLCEGVYTCNDPIDKPGLIIEKRDKQSQVYIIGNDGPVIRIRLLENEFVVFKRITLAHSGINMQAKFKEAAPQEPKYKQLPSLKGIKEFEIQDNHDCVVFLEEGGAMFRHCNITMKSMPK